MGDGSEWGINLHYKIQPKPGGLAESFILGEDFIRGYPSALILGDNIFYGSGLEQMLEDANEKQNTASIFAYRVSDPERFGVVEFDNDSKAISIEEKPSNPKSNYAVTGLYFYDKNVIDFAKNLKPSARGELEITDLNKLYLENNSLNVEILTRGYAWLDTGTPESLIEASHFIYTLEKRQGKKISCLEEIALYKGWLSKEDLLKNISNKKGHYIDYLRELIER